MRLVGFHRFHADVQFFRDLARCVAVADQAKDLEFAIGKISHGRMLHGRCASHILLQHFSGDPVA